MEESKRSACVGGYESDSDGGAVDEGEECGLGDGGRAEQEPHWGVSVQVQVGEFRFVCAIGEGGQDVRWLAVNAAQRYAAHVRANA